MSSVFRKTNSNAAPSILLFKSTGIYSFSITSSAMFFIWICQPAICFIASLLSEFSAKKSDTNNFKSALTLSTQDVIFWLTASILLICH